MKPHAAPPAPWWISLLGLIAYAAVATGAIYLAFVLLTSLHGYIPSSLP